MLCIKEMNLLKKCNWGAAAPPGPGAELLVERRGPLLGRSTQCAQWGCAKLPYSQGGRWTGDFVLWIPFLVLCSKFHILDFKFVIWIFKEITVCFRLNWPIYFSVSILTTDWPPSPLPCVPFAFCRNSYCPPINCVIYHIYLPSLEYKLHEGRIIWFFAQ